MKIQNLITRQLSLIPIFYFCLTVQLPAQLELFPETVRFDSLMTYIGVQKTGGILPPNNLVFRNYDQHKTNDQVFFGNIDFDTKGGVIFKTNGVAIGAFSQFGLLMDNNVKIIRGKTGFRDLLPFAYGKIDATGNILSGTSNYTVTQPQTGIYEIKFSEANVYDLVLHVTPLAKNNEAQLNIVVHAITSIKDVTTLTIRTLVLGTLQSRTFNFIAYLP